LVFAVVLLAPDNTLESVQQFLVNFLADIKQYAIIGPIFQTIRLKYSDGKPEPTDRRASFISPFNKRREKSLISSGFFSTLNQR
jgi:hypothetical protein